MHEHQYQNSVSTPFTSVLYQAPKTDVEQQPGQIE